MNSSNIDKYFSDALIVACISGYAYLLSYAYELGYCLRFHIPRHLIAPNITTIIIAALVVGTLFFSSMNMLNIATPLFRAITDERKKAFHPVLKINCFLLIAGVVLFYIYGFLTNWYWYWLSVVIVLDIVFIGIPLLAHKDKSTLAEKFEASYRSENSFTIYDPLINKIGRKRFLSGIILIGVLLVAGFAGDSEAIKQKQFLVLTKDSTKVFLRSYGDYMIFAKINRATKSFMNEIIVIHSPTYGPIDLMEENIGPINTSVESLPTNNISIPSAIIDSNKVHLKDTISAIK